VAAAVVAPIVGVLLLGNVLEDAILAILLLPILVLVLGSYLTARSADKRFGGAFLCSFLLSSILVLWGSAAWLNSLYGW